MVFELEFCMTRSGKMSGSIVDGGEGKLPCLQLWS